MAVPTRREQLYPNTEKLEMFARFKRDGWDVWGDQVPKDTQRLLR